jgi:HEAT repeat protein
MHLVSGKAAVPRLLELLREARSEFVNFAIDCLGDKGPEAKAAVPDLIKILNSEVRPARLLSTHEYAAIALGRIGPAAEAAVPSLVRLAEKLAPEEWKKASDHQPELRNDRFGGKKYSDDHFVDAICKIRPN